MASAVMGHATAEVDFTGACLPGSIKFKGFTPAQFTGVNGANVIGQAVCGMMLPTDSRSTAAEYSRLLSGNILNGIAQPYLMIQVNGGYDADIGINNIHSIQTATDAHFQNNDVDFIAHKNIQRRQSTKLKIAEEVITTQGFYTGKSITDQRIRNHFSVNADALIELLQVRRCPGTGTNTGRLQQRRECRHSAAFTIGTSHGNHFDTALVGKYLSRKQCAGHPVGPFQSEHHLVLGATRLKKREPVREGAWKVGSRCFHLCTFSPVEAALRKFTRLTTGKRTFFQG